MPAHPLTSACLTGAAWLLLATSLHAQPRPPLRVDEDQMRAMFQAEGMSLSLPISNDGSAPVTAALHVEILDPDDRPFATTDRRVRLPHGMTRQAVLLPDAGVARGFKRALARVRYQVTPEGANPGVGGIVALGAIAPNLFVLHVAHAREAVAGTAYRIRVHAVNPVTRRPLPDVQISGTITPDTDARMLPVLARTNAAGEAVLEWPGSATAVLSSAAIVVRGRKGAEEEEAASLAVAFSLRQTLIVSTDKRLYQPGQALHVRTLVFDARKHAVAGARVRFALDDPDGATILRAGATTNRFGVASTDWQLPEAVRLGDYQLVTDVPDSEEREGPSNRSLVRIARYELPTFTVSASTDRSYYLPGQDAVLTIDARYLFGRPVSAGAVRVVREVGRRWDYTTQAWVGDEADQQSAELDATGHGSITVPLAGVFSRLRRQYENDYEDVTCAVFVTDRSTGRTEQRRIALRVSRDPIHVYVSGRRRFGSFASFAVTTSRPDGTAVPALVQVVELDAGGATRLLRSIETNRFGAARVSRLELAQTLDNDSGTTLALDVHDRAGQQVRVAVESSLFEDQGAEVATDKTVYRPGEPVLVSVVGSVRTRVVLNAVRDRDILWSTSLTLKDGHGFAIVPFREQFRGPITLVAEVADGSGAAHGIGHRTIVYPHDDDLRVRIHSARRTHAPGDDLRAGVRVTAADGTGVAGVLGVAIVDQAVEERATTDEPFRGEASAFWRWSWRRGAARVGDLTPDALARLDLTREVPQDVDLAADVLLDAGGFSSYEAFEGYEDATDVGFRGRIERQLAPAREALRAAPALPATDDEVRAALDKAVVPAYRLVDPWGTRYTFRFGLDVRDRTITVASAGPDKRPGTRDDIVALSLSWNHFTPTGTVLDRSVTSWLSRAGGFVRDMDSLRAATAAAGLDIGQVRNPWGVPYTFQFATDGSWFRVYVRNAVRDKGTWRSTAGEIVWVTTTDYFAQPRADLDLVYTRYFDQTGHIPRTDQELDEAVRNAASDFRTLVDPWGHPYYAVYGESFHYSQELRYAFNTPEQPINATTRRFDNVRILSAGPDGQRGTQDDFQLAEVTQAVSDEGAESAAPRRRVSRSVTGDTGAIEGIVTDASGGVLPGVRVQCRNEGAGMQHSAESNGEGRFTLSGLPAGPYRVEVGLPGFETLTIRFVPVERGSATPLNVVLSVGRLQETVAVTGIEPVLETAMASTARASTDGPERELGTRQGGALRTYTPRVREYLPETLLWAPAIATSPHGTATISVTLADTLTTWKMAVIASTVTGEIGYGDAAIEAFQPVMVEHDPPKVLTAGDQIDLPVVLRSYLDRPASARVELAAAPWFAPRGPLTQTVSVEPGVPATVVFPFTATVAATGRQRVTARAGGAGDAVDKPVVVRPDGEERSVTVAGRFSDTTRLELVLPEHILPGTLTSSLRIYPGLLAHVIDGIEGTLQRPYGCGEQTISSAYPSVLLLRHYKAAGVSGTPLARQAGAYARLGVERLRGYQDQGGGFGYWRPGDPDVALTAYAVRFLVDAADVTAVADAEVAHAASWLVSQQQGDGTWRPTSGDGETLTAAVARSLASVTAHLTDETVRARVQASVRAALPLSRSAGQPYSIAQLAIAAWIVGAHDDARLAVETLRRAVHHEGLHAYWALETNTPFYAWGRAGRIETTAIVIEALQRIEGAGAAALVDQGLAFLLSEKDRYGVWYSGHATVDVLSTLLALLGHDTAAPAATATVTVNGRPALTVNLPRGGDATPILRDLAVPLHAGSNTIEIRRTGGGGHASVQATSAFYVPWPTDQRTVPTGSSGGLRLDVVFDSTSARVGDDVTVTVEVERGGNRGHGMLLAEIGLPPGAEVDRASLEAVVAKSGDLRRYEVRPDRVVAYVWPRAGGTHFTFAFRPRLALVAKTAPSVLYDYYNPDEGASVAPVLFTVASQPVAAASSPGNGGR